MFTLERPTETSLGSDDTDVATPGGTTESPRSGPVALPAILAAAAFASLGAGAIHATAAGAHSEHRSTVIAFVAIAILQIGWGVVALLRPQRLVSLAGVLINGAAVGGWVMAKTSGISFVTGLEESESAQFADTVAAGLAIAAIVGALLSLAPRVSWARKPNAFVLGVAALATIGITSPAMVQTGGHSHAGGAHGDMAGMEHGHAGTEAHAETNIPPQKYDGTLPVDFSGVPGVTPEQQAYAEDLATRTIEDLPQFADYKYAESQGYHTIGDGLTGNEHFIKWDTINDDNFFDPNEPESLVYDTKPDGTKTLAAAMFMLPSSVSLDDVPLDGGSLIQYHVHDNLCFTADPVAPRVAGITTADGTCRPPSVKLPEAPMIHVWIREHPCGPFAALEGIGGGTIAAGETVNCNHTHGSG